MTPTFYCDLSSHSTPFPHFWEHTIPQYLTHHQVEMLDRASSIQKEELLYTKVDSSVILNIKVPIQGVVRITIQSA